MKRALDNLISNNRAEDVDNTLLQFIKDFPPTAVYNNEITPEIILPDQLALNRKEIILEEIFLLKIENINPATSSLEEFYSDKDWLLSQSTTRLLNNLKFFQNEKPLGPENLSLFDFLRRPIIVNPYSLEDQLNL
jgi:hypothetical protein